MIELQDISLRRGPEPLLEDTSLSIGPGWHVGITGRNGTGKSSLLALIRGELEVDQGEVRVPRDWRMASMAQEVPASPQPALQYVLDGDTALRQAEAELKTAEQAGDGDGIARAHEALGNADAWSAEARAAELLSGLGFAERDHARPLSDFSGGWRMRLNMARILMADADLLLLDEPTNHLDLDAVLWLQSALRQSRATLLLISHDREFLDGCVDHIVHLEHRRLNHYSGSYSEFEQRRAEQLAQQQQQYEKQQAEAARLQGFIDRFRAKATKAKQAQSRIKALERMERIAPAHVDAGFSFHFLSPEKIPDPMLDLRGVATGYDDTPILRDLSLTIRPETRLGLLGPNGAGKSTLIRLLAGQLEDSAGELHRDPTLRVGYFEQQQVDALPADGTPLALLRRQCPELDEQQCRNYLGGFGFRGDDVEAPVRRFSGGEKARLGLALLIRERPALLLMDEPTNHLDLDMREALAVALQEFSGALVIISHDRHLLETTVDEFLLVSDGSARPFDGDLTDYASWLRERSAARAAPQKSADAPREDARGRRRAAADRRARLKPLRDRIARLERELDSCQASLVDLESALADTGLYGEERKQELTGLLGEQAKHRQSQQDLEEQLLAAMEELESAEGA